MKCPTCGQICRNNREVCALCGTPLKQKRSHAGLIALILILVLAAVGFLVYEFVLKDLLPTRQEEPASAPAAETDAPLPAETPAPTPMEIVIPEQKAEPPEEEPALPEEEKKELPADFLFENAARIYAMSSYSLALSRDGTVQLAGQSASPEFGLDLFDWTEIKQLLPTDVFVAGVTESGRVRLTGEVSGLEEAARWTDVLVLFYDNGNLLAMTKDNRVLAVGPDWEPDLSDLEDIVNVLPGTYDSVAVAMDGRSTYLKRSGALWDASGLYGLVDVAVGSDYALYLMEDGSVRSSATLFQILGYDRENPFDDWGNLRQIEILDQYAAGLTRDGTVLTASPIPGEWTPDTSAWTGVVRLVPEKSRGMLFALTESGRVLAAPDAAAEAVSGWQNIKELLANESYVVGLTADGHVLTWAAEGAKPLDTGDWENVTDISLGRAHLLALLADGTVLATGDNSFGQCG